MIIHDHSVSVGEIPSVEIVDKTVIIVIYSIRGSGLAKLVESALAQIAPDILSEVRVIYVATRINDGNGDFLRRASLEPGLAGVYVFDSPVERHRRVFVTSAAWVGSVVFCAREALLISFLR